MSELLIFNDKTMARFFFICLEEKAVKNTIFLEESGLLSSFLEDFSDTLLVKSECFLSCCTYFLLALRYSFFTLFSVRLYSFRYIILYSKVKSRDRSTVIVLAVEKAVKLNGDGQLLTVIFLLYYQYLFSSPLLLKQDQSDLEWLIWRSYNFN